ncbi:hypothetical protein [uncultured Ruegeria sp.]|uniref:hypothetical protein n=1 Tax=uncultured Ruegeria sp. TaxID=259304 RepID=UPI0026375574|nr:hypothetical protein [uncultured Ruegeria sp.]
MIQIDPEAVLLLAAFAMAFGIATIRHINDILTITYHAKGLGDPFCVATET